MCCVIIVVLLLFCCVIIIDRCWDKELELGRTIAAVLRADAESDSNSEGGRLITGLSRQLNERVTGLILGRSSLEKSCLCRKSGVQEREVEMAEK